MAHNDLLERIKRLDVQTIGKMSPESIARLTHNFDELLVRNMLYTATTNYEQRKVIKKIKEAYKSWKKVTEMLWGSLPQLEVYPEFMEELQTDIECGLVITEKGSFEEDLGSPKLKLSLISSNAVPMKATESVQTNDPEVLLAKIRELEKHLAEANDINAQQTTHIKELNEQVNEMKLKLAESSGEQVWIDWLDWDVFHPSINAEKVYNVIDQKATPELGEKAKCYAFFRVMKEIKWLRKNAAQKDVLKWWSAHFGCEWHSDNQLKFTELPDAITQATTTDQWKDTGGNNNMYYYNFAQDLKKAFVWNKGRGQYETKHQFVKEGCLPPEKCK